MDPHPSTAAPEKADAWLAILSRARAHYLRGNCDDGRMAAMRVAMEDTVVAALVAAIIRAGDARSYGAAPARARSAGNTSPPSSATARSGSGPSGGPNDT